MKIFEVDGLSTPNKPTVIITLDGLLHIRLGDEFSLGMEDEFRDSSVIS